MTDVLYGSVLLLGIPALLVLAVGWIRQFAELLWLITLRRRVMLAAMIVTVGLVSGILRASWGLAPAGPLSFSVALVALPFGAVPLGNWIAYLRRSAEHRELAWRSYIIDATRLDQRIAYEAPISEQ